MLEPVADATAVLHKETNLIFVVGGVKAGLYVTDTIQFYNINHDEWRLHFNKLT